MCDSMRQGESGRREKQYRCMPAAQPRLLLCLTGEKVRKSVRPCREIYSRLLQVENVPQCAGESEGRRERNTMGADLGS